MSTPELDKLRALSELFQVSMDELVRGQGSNASADEVRRNDTAAESKIGIGLCVSGAIGLILSGIVMIARPSAMEQVDASSAITLNGTGMLMILFVSFMVVGMILTVRKK